MAQASSGFDNKKDNNIIYVFKHSFSATNTLYTTSFQSKPHIFLYKMILSRISVSKQAILVAFTISPDVENTSYVFTGGLCLARPHL